MCESGPEWALKKHDQLLKKKIHKKSQKKYMGLYSNQKKAIHPTDMGQLKAMYCSTNARLWWKKIRHTHSKITMWIWIPRIMCMNQFRNTTAI